MTTTAPTITVQPSDFDRYAWYWSCSDCIDKWNNNAIPYPPSGFGYLSTEGAAKAAGANHLARVHGLTHGLVA